MTVWFTVSIRNVKKKHVTNSRISFIISYFTSNCWLFKVTLIDSKHASHLPIFINNCTFHDYHNVTILRMYYNSDDHALVLIKDTKVSNNVQRMNAILQIQRTQLKLESIVLSANVILNNIHDSIIEASNSYFGFENYNEILHNSTYYMITVNTFIHFQEHSFLNIS